MFKIGHNNIISPNGSWITLFKPNISLVTINKTNDFFIQSSTGGAFNGLEQMRSTVKMMQQVYKQEGLFRSWVQPEELDCFQRN